MEIAPCSSSGVDEYDTTGNVTGVEITARDGTTRPWTVTVDTSAPVARNRVRWLRGP